MWITEIFHSIQGESTYAGLPCVFVRLTGCHLRCVWCDSEYAFYGGKRMSVEEVVDAVKQYDCRLVEITGGEPLLQKEVYPLMEQLLMEGYEVLIETSGSLDVGRVPREVVKIVDLKCPGSGEAHQNRFENLEHLSPKDEVKFVIKDRRDFEWAAGVVRKHSLVSRCLVLFSPVFGELEPRQLAEWILESGLLVRLQLQIHKFVWDPTMRGV